MWDVGCGMWDVGCGMWDVGCGMWDIDVMACRCAMGDAIYIGGVGCRRHGMHMCNVRCQYLGDVGCGMFDVGSRCRGM